MIIQRCQDKCYKFLTPLGMQSSAFRCNFVPDQSTSECNTAVSTDHARRERVLQIIKVEDKCASFANIIVDVTPDSDLLNIVDDESMGFGVVAVVIVGLLGHVRHDFRPIVRHYEVVELQTRMTVKLV